MRSKTKTMMLGKMCRNIKIKPATAMMADTVIAARLPTNLVVADGAWRRD